MHTHSTRRIAAPRAGLFFTRTLVDSSFCSTISLAVSQVKHATSSVLTRIGPYNFNCLLPINARAPLTYAHRFFIKSVLRHLLFFMLRRLEMQGGGHRGGILTNFWQKSFLYSTNTVVKITRKGCGL